MKGEQPSYEMIETQPRDFDFGQGYCETWQIPLDLTEKEIENEEYTPMMNYIYPLPDNFHVPDDFREKLNSTTIVRIDGKYYLALTGGGMDLSWEICETYLNLGYYPPVHFCRVPAMAGRGKSARDRRIIDACDQSLRSVIKWYTARLKDNAKAHQGAW